MELNRLVRSYRLAEKNKKRNPIRVGYELHKYRNLLRLKRSIEDHTFTPTAYAYVVYRPVIREVFSAPMDVCVIDHLLDELIRPHMEAWLNPCVFNNRKGLGLERAMDKVVDDIAVLTRRYTTDCYGIVCDITGYFPNASMDYAYSVLEPLLLQATEGDQSENIFLLQRALYMDHARIERKSLIACWQDVRPHKSIFTKPFGTGAMPGRLMMQMAMTCYHDAVIKWLLSCGARVTVYGDDFLMLTTDKDRFLRYILPEFRRRMTDIGCQVHPHKFYCQHYSKGIRFCSQVVKFDRKYIGKRTAYNFSQKIRRYRHRARPDAVPHLVSSFNSYIGFAKHRNAYGIIRSAVSEIVNLYGNFVRYSEERAAILPQPEYEHRSRLTAKYNLKIVTQYDKKRNRRKAPDARRGAVATHSADGRE